MAVNGTGAGSTCSGGRVAPPKVTLDAAGVPPLRELRFSGSADQQFQLSWRWDNQISLDGEVSTDVGSVAATVQAVRHQLSGDGSPIEVRLLAVTPGQRTFNGERWVEGEDTALYAAPLAEVCGEQTTGGALLVDTPERGAAEDPQGLFIQIVEAQLAVFPDGPIGVGASWTRIERVRSDGADYERVWRLTLESFDGTSYTVRGTASFTRDETTNPNAPPDSDLVDIDNVTLAASGRTDQPFPTSATLTYDRMQRSAFLGMDNRVGVVVTIS